MFGFENTRTLNTEMWRTLSVIRLVDEHYKENREKNVEHNHFH